MDYAELTSQEPLPNCINAVIFDIDGTIQRDKPQHDKPVASYVGEYLLKRELRSGHFKTWFNGYLGSRKVKELAKNNGIRGKAKGLKKFVEVVKDNIDLKKKTLYELTKKALVENEIDDFSQFIHELQERGVSTFFSTVSYDVVGEAAVDIYNGDGYAANPTIWTNPNGHIVTGKEIFYKGSSTNSPSVEEDAILTGFMPKIVTGGHKKRVNRNLVMKKAGFEKEEIGMVGNDFLDHPSMEYFGLAIAPPFADEETVKLVKEKNGRIIGNYNEACKLLLKGFQPRKL
jgi:hypothetical protein